MIWITWNILKSVISQWHSTPDKLKLLEKWNWTEAVLKRSLLLLIDPCKALAKNSRYQQLEGATCCFTCWLDHPISKQGHCRTCMILLFRIPLYLHTQGGIQSGEVNALAEHMEGQSVSWWPPCSMLFKARRWCLRARETTERQRRDNRELLRLSNFLKSESSKCSKTSHREQHFHESKNRHRRATRRGEI